jgi:uncharacterized protein YjbI with pentapeptide repeats
MCDPDYEIPYDDKVSSDDILPESDLRDANLSDANLRDADLSRADLRNAKLSGADLRDVNLSGADLQNADLSGSIFDGDFNKNLQGITPADLSGAKLENADLSEANLKGVDLSGKNLRNVDFSGAKLKNSDLSRASLSAANLVGANLWGADLSEAIFGPTLRENPADLSEANLWSADLQNANLRGVDLSKADLRRASLTNTDLRKAKMEEVQVDGGTMCSQLNEERLGAADLAYHWDNTARSYNNLKKAFSNYGLMNKARRMHLRERRARSFEARASYGLFSWQYVSTLFSRFITGYGVQLRTLFFWMLVLFVGSTVVYQYFGIRSTTTEIIVYSVLAFTVAPPPPLPSGILVQTVVMIETFFGTLSTVLFGYILGNREQV